MEVLFITNIPSPYRMDFFNELGKNCSLTVVFEKKGLKERDKSWLDFSCDNFKGIFINEEKGSISVFKMIRFLNNKIFDYIFVTNPSTLIGIVSILTLRRLKLKYFLEGDGAILGKESYLKYRIKKFIISGADAYFSSGRRLDEYYIRYGADKSKIYRYPFTSIKKDYILKNTIDECEKKRVRKELNLPVNKKIFITVGSFIKRKGFYELIKSWNNNDKDKILIIIGGGEEKNKYLDYMKKNNIDNIKLIEFLNPGELKKYYICVDLFVFPTNYDIWALVINEAMACGLPIISTDNCVAAIELVEDNKNGFLVDVNNKKAILEKADELLKDNKLISEISKNNIKKISKYTIEEMANYHYCYLRDMKENKDLNFKNLI